MSTRVFKILDESNIQELVVPEEASFSVHTLYEEYRWGQVYQVPLPATLQCKAVDTEVGLYPFGGVEVLLWEYRAAGTCANKDGGEIFHFVWDDNALPMDKGRLESIMIGIMDGGELVE